MKKATLFLSAAFAGLALIVSCTQNPAAKTESTETSEAGAPAGSIVFFNLDRVINEYDMANDLRSVAETKVNSINQEVNRRASKLDKDVKAFQDKLNKGLLTQSVAEQQNRKLQEQNQNFQNYAAQKQQEIAEEQQVMMNKIADAINTFVLKYNEKMGYAMILTTQGDLLPAPVVTADPKLDITDDILEGLNAEYVANKGKEDKEEEEE